MYHNYFSLIDLDRMTEFRVHKENLEKMLHEPESLIIPVFQLKNLISYNTETKAVLLKLQDLAEYPSDDFVFLGKYNGNYFFTIDLKEGTKATARDNYRFEDLRKIAPLLNFKEAALLAYARAIIYWRSRTKYCGMCGSPTNSEEGGHRAFCAQCNSNYFPRTDPAIITIVTHKEKCLLARQPSWPAKRYSTIAGFVEPGESLEDAVYREVFEETGVRIKDVKYFSSQPWPFPGSLMIGFKAAAETTEINLHDHELEEAKWFSREEIIEKLNQNEFKLPTEISISFRLVEDWFDSDSKFKLRDLLHSIK